MTPRTIRWLAILGILSGLSLPSSASGAEAEGSENAAKLVRALQYGGTVSEKLYYTVLRDPNVSPADLIEIAKVDTRTAFQLARDRGARANDMEQLAYWLCSDTKNKVASDEDAYFISLTYANWSGFDTQHEYRRDIHPPIELMVQRSLAALVTNDFEKKKITSVLHTTELKVGVLFQTIKVVPLESEELVIILEGWNDEAWTAPPMKKPPIKIPDHVQLVPPGN